MNNAGPARTEVVEAVMDRVIRPSRRAISGLSLILGFLALSFLVVSCGRDERPQPPGQQGLTRTDDQREVTVKVTWNGKLDPLSFDVALDTHSVDLDSYDLSRIAVLRTASGQEMPASGWDAPKGGHHRAGRLEFGSLDKGFLSNGILELVIRNVNGVPERGFRWDLN